ncbi:adenylate kinase family protein [Marinobacter confluentis]|uniref:AAA family ATPase n=1 Tax=Marinobacter confluentis TaxID=1697557 RepID=A0A4Z1C2I5_9GAMM|nr:hypothetical protein [Marinobacter confluentis]TGN40331.1 hypothetical protein E5Q11_08660 [Marinobacter confluentis]
MTDIATNKTLVLLSGPVAAGKTSLLKTVGQHIPLGRISTGWFLRQQVERLSSEFTRYDLQEYGDKLDLETNFSWIYWDLVLPYLKDSPDCNLWFLDSVRKLEQVHCIRSNFEGRVLHVHVTASDDVLSERYLSRGRIEDENAYTTVGLHSNEIAARALIDVADSVLELSSGPKNREKIESLIENLKV